MNKYEFEIFVKSREPFSETIIKSMVVQAYNYEHAMELAYEKIHCDYDPSLEIILGQMTSTNDAIMLEYLEELNELKARHGVE